MKILVIGSGGREHAIVWKIAQSPLVTKIFAAPGNPGIAEIAECVSLSATDIDGLLEFASKNSIELTVVGPEVPLAEGIVDRFEAHGLKIFGPNKAAAQIEASKVFCKNLMQKYGIPSAAYATFTEVAEASEYVENVKMPVVIKADGLAAGKGVIIAETVAEAKEAIATIMADQKFGAAGSEIVVEEFLKGEEASLLAFVDGTTVYPMVAAQDHKQVFDGDKGPNTGGMGTYSPAPVLTAELYEQATKDILEPTVRALAAEGITYKGVLYAGLMITAEGMKVLEYNCRFGDPETQVVLPRMKSDLVEMMLACVEGTLDTKELEWYNDAAVCVILASGGYPEKYEKGKPISGLDQLPKGVVAFHAGTKACGDGICTNGGRVLGITAMGDTLKDAIDKAYAGVEKVTFEGMHFRKDIGAKALK